MSHGTFCTVFDCMDGRCKSIVGEWVTNEWQVEYPDTVTIAGCDGVLLSNEAERERAFAMAKISVDKHGARHAAIVGHSECAGNPVSDDEHRDHIREAAQHIVATNLFDEVVGLYVDVGNKSVEVVVRHV